VDLNKNETFPEGFLWGAGTAAYQIEGAWNLAGKGESIWDRFTHTPGKIFNGDTGDFACDYYHRFAEDILHAKAMNLNAYRFSISWPRVQPEGLGAFNQQGLDFYDRVIDLTLQAGMEPFVTLYHWDLPQNLEGNIGGWASRQTAQYFSQYTSKVVARYSDRVKNWTSLNEPWCSSFLGYQEGIHAPGLKSPEIAKIAAHNLLLAHGLSTQAARASTRQPINFGIVLNLTISEPLLPADVELAEKNWRDDCDAYLEPLYRGKYSDQRLSGIANFKSGDLEIINQKLDYLGINFYRRNVVSKTSFKHPLPGSSYTDMDWEITPKSLRVLLNRISKEYGYPNIYITENGAAFDDLFDAGNRVCDQKRIEYLKAHVIEARHAIADGVNLKGFFAWSLLDNFEWSEGYRRRFGLIYVDYPTQKRIVKESGKWYGELARTNGVSI
jgi:beta-glucosidase